MTRTQSTLGLLCTGLGSLSIIAACSVTRPGATDANMARARSLSGEGAELYEHRCATCHGPRGEGLAGAPSVIGAGALPRFPRDQAGVALYQDPNQVQRQNAQRVPGAPSRPELVTAGDLGDLLRKHVAQRRGPDDPEWTDRELWSVLSFVLIAHGADVPAGGVTPENAQSVRIRP